MRPESEADFITRPAPYVASQPAQQHGSGQGLASDAGDGQRRTKEEIVRVILKGLVLNAFSVRNTGCGWLSWGGVVSHFACQLTRWPPLFACLEETWFLSFWASAGHQSGGLTGG